MYKSGMSTRDVARFIESMLGSQLFCNDHEQHYRHGT
ncbi:hypothetical protein [Paenibacillus sp. FSL P2-0136]